MNRRAFLAASATLPLLPRLARAASAPLIMQASWINDAEFSGYFVAIDQGYFAAEGLDLTYLSGGPDVIPESSIIAGRADLTLTTPDTTIKAIAEQGAPFKIIGTQYQKNPIGIVSLAKAPIKSPADMVGKTIAVPPVNTISVEAMLAINGIDKASVNIVPYAYDPTPLIKGEIDGSLDFTTNVPFTIKTMGEEAVSFLLYDHGFTIFNDTVVVTEETLKTQAHRARRLAARFPQGLGGKLRRSRRLAAEVGGHLVQGHRPQHRERDLLQHRAEAADRVAERHLLDVGGEHRGEPRGARQGRHHRHAARCSTPRSSPSSDADARPDGGGHRARRPRQDLCRARQVGRGAARRLARLPAGVVHRADRPFRLRQVDDPAGGARPRAARLRGRC